MTPLSISVQYLLELYKNDGNPFVLDVRETWELKKVSLKKAVHIPLSLVPHEMAQLPKNQPLYVICHHGVRSLKVALFLREEGYEAYSVTGGLDAWAREIDSSIGFY